ncbi:hypothetical protein LWI29_003259 [Acer saccharum]|uniref:Uncharacterized protein n=1 Tax=Acer saccharum TaxID=4024 RepID=A0AA39W8T9_ACESA|nr:hypothetical protein LWI29_003259 [Acer saccharum]
MIACGVQIWAVRWSTSAGPPAPLTGSNRPVARRWSCAGHQRQSPSLAPLDWRWWQRLTSSAQAKIGLCAGPALVHQRRLCAGPPTPVHQRKTPSGMPLVVRWYGPAQGHQRQSPSCAPLDWRLCVHVTTSAKAKMCLCAGPAPVVQRSPETDDYLREIQEEEEDRLREFLTEEEIDEQFDDEVYHNLDT